MTKRCALSTGYLPQEGLPRNSVDRITDSPDMTSAVDRGRKASIQQTNKILGNIQYFRPKVTLHFSVLNISILVLI